MTTQNTKHTPGPFKTDSATHRGCTYLQSTQPDANGGWVIATFWGPDREANARLAASVPDLLCALRRARIALNADAVADVYALGSTWAQARLSALAEVDAAISKAEGQQ